jgi:hypothetical protein
VKIGPGTSRALEALERLVEEEDIVEAGPSRGALDSQDLRRGEARLSREVLGRATESDPPLAEWTGRCELTFAGCCRHAAMLATACR